MNSLASPVETFLVGRVELAATVYDLAQDTTGEPFAPNYHDYPKALAGLVRATARLELAIKQFQKRQADALEHYINFANLSLHSFDQFDNILIDVQWNQDQDDLQGVFVAALPEAMVAGSLMSQQELGFTIDYAPEDAPAQQFLSRYTPKLAGEVTDTTKLRVTNALKQSIAAGESRDELEQRLTQVIDNPIRARTIAQTESVRAFTQGRLQAGRKMGATDKTWHAQITAVDFCGDLDGETVALEDEFSTGDDGPPAHPNCRCSLKLSFGKEADTANN